MPSNTRLDDDPIIVRSKRRTHGQRTGSRSRAPHAANEEVADLILSGPAAPHLCERLPAGGTVAGHARVRFVGLIVPVQIDGAPPAGQGTAHRCAGHRRGHQFGLDRVLRSWLDRGCGAGGAEASFWRARGGSRASSGPPRSHDGGLRLVTPRRGRGRQPVAREVAWRLWLRSVEDGCSLNAAGAIASQLGARGSLVDPFTVDTEINGLRIQAHRRVGAIVRAAAHIGGAKALGTVRARACGA